MSDIHVMRKRLSELYGESWREKVKNMSDKQVTAVFFKFQMKGLIK